MGIITRHAGAPFQDGEILTGPDLEQDFDTIYTEFNGGIDSANLADDAVTTGKILNSAVTSAKIANGAVTTDKLAANAVTQEKMTDGAATASESEFTSGDVNVTPTNTYVTLETISHDVGDPARHVALYYTVQHTTTSVRVFTFAIFKDTSLIADSEISAELLAFSSVGRSMVSGVFVDPSPTAGATHSYELKAKCGGAATGTIGKISFFALEPRS